MEKELMLRWATGDQIRIPDTRDGEWQLRFKCSTGRDFANKHLSRAQWLGIESSLDDEILYSFIDDGAKISDVLQNLHASGIPHNEIEIDPSAWSRAAKAGR
jgi:hypothetical protein